MGDEVQAIKAGLLEVADIVVVNKGDRPGAQRTAAQLRAMLVPTVARRDMDPSRPLPKRPEVLVTTALTGDGIPELIAALDRHRASAARRRGVPVAPRAARRRRSGRSSWSGSGTGSRRPRWPRDRRGDPRRRRPRARPVRGRRRAPGRRREGRRAMSVERVFVAGAGLMGHGIAPGPRGRRQAVTLYEPDLARAEAGRDRIAGNLDRSVAKGKLSAGGAGRDPGAARSRPTTSARPPTPTSSSRPCSRTSTSRRASGPTSTSVAPGGRDLRLEHVVDRHRHASPRQSPSARRARFVGMHFFSPVPVMPLIELIRGTATTDDDRGRDPRRSPRELGKQVIVSADRPGFIVNRILMPFLAEAMRAYEEGLGHRRGHRHGREGRAQPPDGAARARGLHRPRRLPRASCAC